MRPLRSSFISLKAAQAWCKFAAIAVLRASTRIIFVAPMMATLVSIPRDRITAHHGANK
ncbi:hypothetical protein J8I87_14060 [Paraburkholderia sp. LEh10]|jgi:hypothetical protein|uniref:hypothetical protein n=1 Tax=Paraburkholderia sp. LEh10 TaxID=2821353 RepID=UPI001AE6F65A|nr:hypothetical protein [Paraburkholderia sp. LEh10]MBP0590817.1 hypothetical protein [Paraburkholderia sp. LEh10]